MKDQLTSQANDIEFHLQYVKSFMKELEKQLRESTRIIAYLAEQNGGSVDIPANFLQSVDDNITIGSHWNIEKDCLTITVAKKNETASNLRSTLAETINRIDP